MTSEAEISKFGKVAVILGGTSAEREVSLNSGHAIVKALLTCGVDAHAVDAGKDIISVLERDAYDRVFIALHGRGGEDGTLQGALELMGIPYTGSGVLGCAISMDKLRTKQLWQGVGLPTPEFRLITSEKSLLQAVNDMSYPLMLKPSLEGSSLGISKISNVDDIQHAWDNASSFGCDVIAEAWVEGKEYTASILGEQCFPIIRLETPNEIYDYAAKYEVDTTGYFCPSGLDEESERKYRQLSLQAFRAVGASGWGRVDFICDKDGKPWLIEVNTVPGMTDHSLVPMAAKAEGLDFGQLVTKILALTLAKT
ncbi:MAG: D-alanine--D-alanine ligase [Thiohalomonadales bacterium]